jgi:hypothetical protein
MVLVGLNCKSHLPLFGGNVSQLHSLIKRGALDSQGLTSKRLWTTSRTGKGALTPQWNRRQRLSPLRTSHQARTHMCIASKPSGLTPPGAAWFRGNGRAAPRYAILPVRYDSGLSGVSGRRLPICRQSQLNRLGSTSRLINRHTIAHHTHQFQRDANAWKTPHICDFATTLHFICERIFALALLATPPGRDV